MSNLPPRPGISPADRDINELYDRIRALEASPPAPAAVVAVEILSSGAALTPVLEGAANTTKMPWAHIDGSTLVSYADDTQIAALADGFYMVSVTVEARSAMAVGAGFTIGLAVNGTLMGVGSSPVGAGASSTQQFDTTPGFTPAFAAAANYMLAGDVITVEVTNLNNTAATVDFGIVSGQIIQLTSPVIP